MKRSLTHADPSGIYTCSCGNLETHVEGKSKAPCSKCPNNDKWTLLVSTTELENSLRYPLSCPFDDLVNNIQKRFDSKKK